MAVVQVASIGILQQEEVLFRFVPSARTADENTIVSLDIRISSLGPSIDGVQVAIDVVAPLSFVSVTSGDVDTFIATADGGLDFVATFAATTGDVQLATIRVQTPAERVEMPVPNVVYVNTGDRKTVGTTGDQEIEAALENASVTLTPLVVEFDPFVDSLAFTLTTEETQITLGTADIPATGDFLWRVFAVDGGGNTGDVSEVGQFRRVLPDDAPEPGVPLLVSPVNGARITGDRPTFTWTEVIDGSGVT